MSITIPTISILAITGLIWLTNRILPFKICPICAGVSGTWLWMLAARILGYEIEVIILAMLMGGSVVGIAYQIEKRLPSNRSPLLWKTLFIPAGFIAVYSLLSSWWPAFIAAAILIAILIIQFTKGDGNEIVGPKQNQQVEELKKKLNDCC